MDASRSPQAGRSVVVAVFEAEPPARQAVEALRELGVDQRQVLVVSPGLVTGSSRSVEAGLSPEPSRSAEPGLSQGAGRSAPPGPSSEIEQRLAAAASDGADIASLLVSVGVPEGEARFYAQEVRDGRTLAIVDARDNFGPVRDLLVRRAGYDVQSRGRDLARAEDAGLAGGSGPRPVDLTGNWEDVASRYEMLWEQHYGTTDATWDQVAPVYEFAWYAANDARYRGRRWAEVEAEVRRDWQAAAGADGGPGLAGRAWSEVLGPIRDVWEDVADEATLGAEGGAERRIPRQDTDQRGAAREIVPPA